MSQSLNLKELESLAFRRTFQDGLYDIYLGGLLASFAAFAFKIFPGNEIESRTTLIYFVIGASLSCLVFFLGKIYITLPRIGLVKFGPARQKRAIYLLLALAVIVSVQVVFILFQFFSLQIPGLREWLPPVLGQADNSRLLLAFVAAIFVAPGMLLIAYLTDNPLGYYHAIVLTLAIFLMIMLDHGWWMVLGGGLIVLPGLIQLILFLQRYPLENITNEHS